jgi:hypothetical protein
MTTLPGAVGAEIGLSVLQPAFREPRAAQASDDSRTAAHQFPEELRAVVFRHQDDGAFVQTETIRGNPSSGRSRSVEGRIERGVEAVTIRFFELHIVNEVLESRDHDLRREGK